MENIRYVLCIVYLLDSSALLYLDDIVHCIVRQFEGKHLKSHQDMMNKRVELSGIITRLQSQLAHERQSTTASGKEMSKLQCH